MTTPQSQSPTAARPDAETAAKLAAEQISVKLFPESFCGDEENSAAGHKGEFEAQLEAIILAAITPLLASRDEALAKAEHTLEAYRKRARKLYTPEVAASKIADEREAARVKNDALRSIPILDTDIELEAMRSQALATSAASVAKGMASQP